MKIKYLNLFLISLLFLSLIGNVNAANENTNPDRNLLEKMGKYYHDEFDAEWSILELDSSKLKYGDHIQLKGFDYVFMFSHKDSEGLIYLSSYYGRCTIKQDDFNRLYTKYALLLNH